jgi:hypothetical protein
MTVVGVAWQVEFAVIEHGHALVFYFIPQIHSFLFMAPRTRGAMRRYDNVTPHVSPVLHTFSFALLTIYNKNSLR